MSLTVFVLVIAAAFFHAMWNAFVKGGRDKDVNLAAVMIGHVPFAVPVAAVTPFPDAASWPYLFAGIVLHTGYQLFLLLSYKIGDLTQVYPIARGSAPLLVAFVSIAFLGVQLSSFELLGVVIIAAGILSLALVRRSDGLRNTKAGLTALATGCFIASYSLVDGFGARLSGNAFGFYAWLGLGNALVLALYFSVKRPVVLKHLVTDRKKLMLYAGGASYLAYSLVIWAFTQAPIALVTALRETSIIFALLIGVFVLKERLDLAKVLATVLTLFGVALLRFSKSS